MWFLDGWSDFSLSEHLLTDLIVETKEGQIWALQAKSVQTSLSGHRRKAAIAEL